MKKVLGFLVYATTPIVALAASVTTPTGAPTSIGTSYVDSIFTNVGEWLDLLIPILIGIAVVVFFWGIIRYVTAGADDEKRKEARGLMIWGIIAIFIMVAIWGLVGLLASFLGISTGGTVNAPTLPN